MKNKPAHQIRIGGIKATIWPNNEQETTRYTVTLSRSYKSGDAWRETKSFHKSDLPKITEAIAEAEQWIAKREPSYAE